jgi:hypothetical protein
MPSDDKGMVPVDERPQIAMTEANNDKFGHISARVRAEIQARTAVALARPRDMMDARDKLLKDARRPGFAWDAEYGADGKFKRGGKEIVGPSIRFAEAAARAMRNLDMQVVVLHEDEETRGLDVKVTDLEANTTWSVPVTVPKIVERKDIGRVKPEDVLGSRLNSEGQILYQIKASETDVLMTQNSLVSRAVRTCILRHVPGDIIEDAIRECRKTRTDETAKDPDAARKRIVDSFSGLNVRPSDLATFLDHPVDQCSPAEMEELRGVFVAVRDGIVTWADALRERVAERGKAKDAAGSGTTPAQRIKEKLAERKMGKEAPQTPAVDPTPVTEAKAAEGADPAVKEGKAPDALSLAFDRYQNGQDPDPRD